MTSKRSSTMTMGAKTVKISLRETILQNEMTFAASPFCAHLLHRIHRHTTQPLHLNILHRHDLTCPTSSPSTIPLLPSQGYVNFPNAHRTVGLPLQPSIDTLPVIQMLTFQMTHFIPVRHLDQTNRTAILFHSIGFASINPQRKRLDHSSILLSITSLQRCAIECHANRNKGHKT
jgi:hypothetical protein